MATILTSIFLSVCLTIVEIHSNITQEHFFNIVKDFVREESTQTIQWDNVSDEALMTAFKRDTNTPYCRLIDNYIEVHVKEFRSNSNRILHKLMIRELTCNSGNPWFIRNHPDDTSNQIFTFVKNTDEPRPDDFGIPYYRVSSYSYWMEAPWGTYNVMMEDSSAALEGINDDEMSIEKEFEDMMLDDGPTPMQ